MPLEESIVGLPGFEVLDIQGFHEMEVRVRYVGKTTCPECGGGDLVSKARFLRRIRHENHGSRRCYLLIEGKKYRCKGCGHYFRQQYPGVGKWRRSTEPFRRHIVWQHQHGISQKVISRQERLGSATVERWSHELMDTKLRERLGAPCPRVLGIDEHFFTKRQGYATTLCDLGARRIYDVTLGRSEKALQGYFNALSGKEQVRVVCMDLAAHYRTLVRRYFPKALIVADRFHVIRLVNQQFLATWKLLDPEGRSNRGLLSLMRRHEANLTADQHHNLRRYLEKIPGLGPVYDFKQKLVRLLLIKHRTARQCRNLVRLFLDYLRQLEDSPFGPLVSLSKTLGSWREEIARMWRFTRNNGITEGFHTKMEMISRRAFGFRNFENYRLRVRALCG
jgi:transposase